MKKSFILFLTTLLAATCAFAQNDWKPLFNGSNLDGWTTTGKPEGWAAENGTIACLVKGGSYLYTKDQYENFVLSLDFKVSPPVKKLNPKTQKEEVHKCNSGVFIRTFPLTPRPGKDVGFNGIEIALDDTTTNGRHDTGAIYDLIAPTKNAAKPAGEWNHLVVTCDRNQITVELNGETVTRMDLDEWTKPSERPDGSAHKFDVAYKDHPRKGYIGLQDHGSDCWYRNIKLRPLKDTEKAPSK